MAKREKADGAERCAVEIAAALFTFGQTRMRRLVMVSNPEGGSTKILPGWGEEPLAEYIEKYIRAYGDARVRAALKAKKARAK